MTDANLAANHGGNKIARQLTACSGQRDNDFAIPKAPMIPIGSGRTKQKRRLPEGRRRFFDRDT
jgi:hypothetical protein